MVYAKELKKYTRNELHNKFRFDSEIIKALLERKVLYKSENSTYCFRFVGILIINDLVLFCIPKYVSTSNKVAVVKQILSLFKEYSRREKLDAEEIETIGNIESITKYNLISTIIFLLSDYFENGLYSNEKSIHVLNGEDEINWIKTINQISPIISEGEPVYLEYYTNSIQDDEENYFKLLHRYVLNLCSKELVSLGLLEFLEIEPVYFEEDVDKLGTYQTMISKISNELNEQFVSRKQLVLKAMAQFLSNEKMDIDNATIRFFGTRSFHIVWEKTCGYVLNNKYEDVKKYIAHPKWRTSNGKVHNTDTLIPDIISMNEKSFVISDAKYYNIVLADDKKLSGNPGVEDITKQYLYQLAFEEYIKTRKFQNVKNMLLFPTEEGKIVKIGDVSIKFLKKLKLEEVILVKLPAQKVFEFYISSKRITIEKLLQLTF
jgi:hypothetical protein